MRQRRALRDARWCRRCTAGTAGRRRSAAPAYRRVPRPRRGRPRTARALSSRASTGGLGSDGAGAVAEADADDVLDAASCRRSRRGSADEPLKTTMISAPESLNWCSSSRGVYSGLTFTWTAPARRMPSMAIGKAGRLGSITAMRSPFLHAQSALQKGGEGARQAVDVGVAQRLAEAAERRLVGVARHRVFEHRQDRWIGIRIDLGRYPPAIAREPMPARHFPVSLLTPRLFLRREKAGARLLHGGTAPSYAKRQRNCAKSWPRRADGAGSRSSGRPRP